MGGDCDSRIDRDIARFSGELIKSFQGAVGLLRDTVQRGDFRPGQGQRPPQERCKAVCAGNSCDGESQFLTDPNRFVYARTGCGLARCFLSQQSPGQVSVRWRRPIHNYPTDEVLENATEGADVSRMNAL